MYEWILSWSFRINCLRYLRESIIQLWNLLTNYWWSLFMSYMRYKLFLDRIHLYIVFNSKLLNPWFYFRKLYLHKMQYRLHGKWREWMQYMLFLHEFMLGMQFASHLYKMSSINVFQWNHWSMWSMHYYRMFNMFNINNLLSMWFCQQLWPYFGWYL